MRLRSAFLLQVVVATVPALILLVSIPLVRVQLDPERFAAFTVLLSAVGLLAVLDGGLGRASTFFISLSLKRNDRLHTLSVFHGVLAVGLVFSLALGMAAAAAGHFVSGHALVTARPALLVLTTFAPVFVACSLFRGFLEAEHRFGRSGSLQLIHGTAIGIAPVILFSLSTDPALFAWAVGVARVVMALALLHSAGLANRRSWFVSPSMLIHARRVFGYTKWLFLSNMIGLTIVFADRFFVASLFTSTVVAAYVLPMEMIGRLQIFIGAFCSVIFPKLVARTSDGAASNSHRFVNDAQGAVMAATTAAGFAIASVAEPLMQWWLGDALAPEAARVLVVGAAGVGLIAGAALAMLELNSRGVTRPVALLHAVEMPVYLALLYLAARSSSLELLLLVWIARLATDAIGMTLIAAIGSPSGAASSKATHLRNSTSWTMAVASLLLLSALGLASHKFSWQLKLLIEFAGASVAIITCLRFVARLRLSSQFARQP